MSDIHPTGTASDGRLRPRNTTYKPGDLEQEISGCAQCGFLFRDGKDVEGDSFDAPGITAQTKTVTVNISNSKLPQLLQGNSKFNVATVNAPDPAVNSGCRLCGSLNPKAKGRNADFDYAFRNMENK